MIVCGLKLLRTSLGTPFVIMAAHWFVPTEPIPPTLRFQMGGNKNTSRAPILENWDQRRYQKRKTEHRSAAKDVCGITKVPY